MKTHEEQMQELFLHMHHWYLDNKVDLNKPMTARQTKRFEKEVRKMGHQPRELVSFIRTKLYAKDLPN